MNANLEFWIFATLVAVLLIALSSALLLPLVRTPLRRLKPELRANVILAWCFAPLMLGLIVAFAPGFLSALKLAPAECGRISDAFLQLCGPNCTSSIALPVLFDIGLLAPFLWFFFTGGKRLWAAIILNQKIGTLIAAGCRNRYRDVWIIDSREPFAFTVGLRRTRVVISSYLEKKLSREQMKAVLAHEKTHADRRDMLRYVIAETVSAAHLPWIRSMLLSELRLASEQACDQVAADVTGDNIGVADTLLQVERLFGDRRYDSLVPTHLLGSDVEARIEALLLVSESPAVCPYGLLIGGALAFCAAVMLGAVPLHELTASLLIFFQG